MVYIDGFIKPNKLYMLEEYHRATDLLDLDNNLKDFVDKITSIKESCIVGLIGKLGSGKTTFINQFVKQYDENAVFTFEAWKYPERKYLWENLILEIARQIDEKKFDETLKIIEGKQHKDKSKLLEVVSDLPYLKAIKHFDYFLETSPATRTFQLQSIFRDLLQSITSNKIYIVVEDVDRAGDEGLFFLETLSYYVKEVVIDKQIIVIPLIGEENYNDPTKKSSFQKCLDIKYPFSITNPGFSRFVEELFIDDIVKTPHLKGQIQSFLEGIFLEYPQIAIMRLVKSILRQANMNYIALAKEQGEGIDWRLSILFETAKEVYTDQGISYYKRRKEDGRVISQHKNTIFGALINAIIFENHRMKSSGQSPKSIFKRDESNKKNKTIERGWTVNEINIVENTYQSDIAKDAIWFFTGHFDKDPKYFGISDVYFK